MQKSQIRGIIGNAMLHLASILILCFFALNMIEGIGRNTIYGAITNLATATGINIAYYITASAFHIIVLILAIIMIILSAIGLFGAIFNVKSLNMTIANRVLSIITMISALMALIFMIVYVSLLGIAGTSVGAGPITVFLASILGVVGSFIAYTKRAYNRK